MRKSRNGQRSVLVASTKFIVLLMCFATVFALAMTVGLADDINLNADTGANVAEAASSGGTSTIATESAIGAYDDLQRLLHTSSGSGTWSFGVSNLSFTAQNVSTYTGNVVHTGINHITGTGKWGVSNTTGPTSSTNCAAVNFVAPTFIMDLVSRGYTIEVTATMVWELSSTATPAVALVVSNGAKSAQNLADDGQFTNNYSNNTAPGVGSSGQIHQRLTTGNNIITVGVRSDGDSGWFSNRACSVTVTSTTLNFIITRPSSMPSDGNAPKATQTGNSTLTSNVEQHLNSAINSELRSDITGVSPYDNPGVNNASSGTINMMNAIVRREGLTAGNGSKYAKMLELTVNETNAGGSQASSSSAAYYAGLGEILINGTTVAATSYGSMVAGTFTYSGGNGRVEWTADQYRATGTLKIWFSDNVSGLTLAIKDSGGATASFTH